MKSKESFIPYLIFGALFGYFLSKARATDYDTIEDMFLFRDPQLYGVIGVAIVTVVLGLFILKRWGKPTSSGEELDWKPLEFEPNRLIGAFIFGIGWALAGTCPGTALAQIGEGKVVALFTVAGIFIGVWAFSKTKFASSSEDDVC
jgi:uncharacterized protein